jgi:uncharacterized Zn-finger protein
MSNAMNCKVEGCHKAANRKAAQLCESHYMRFRRRGTFDKVPKVETANHSNGYILEHRDGHPLCTPGGGNTVFQHRRVFYDAHGKGPFNCHWCEAVVTWSYLHIDHLNENKKDNAISNLVASCQVCNQGRGRWKSIAKSKHGGKVIEFDGKSYCLIDWARLLGLTPQGLLFRIERWGVEAALTRPKGNTGPPPDQTSKSQRLLASITARPMELTGNTLASMGL